MGEINRDKAVAALESLQKRGADLNPYSLAVELGVDYKQIIGDAETMQMLSYARGDVHGIVAAEYDRLLRRVDELSEELVKAQESSDSDLIDQISEELAAFKERNKALTKQIKELEAANQVLALSIQDSYEQGNQAGKQELESAVYKAAEESYLKGFEAANIESEKKATEAFQKGIDSAKLELEQGLEEEMKQALEDSYQKGLEAGKAAVEQGPWPFAEDVNTAELTKTPAESWKEGYESARLELEEQYGSANKEQAWKEGYEAAKSELEEELAESGKASWQQGFESAKKELAADIDAAAQKAKQEGYDLARAELEDEIANANKASWQDGYEAAKNELEEELAESGKASWQQGYDTAKRELEEKAAVSGTYDDGYNAAKSEFEEEMKKVRDEWWNEGYDTAALEFKNREKEKERESKEVPSGDNAFEEGYQLAQMELEESFAKEREEIRKKAFEEAKEELQKEEKKSPAKPSQELLKLEWQKGFDAARAELEQKQAEPETLKEEWQKGFDAARAELEQNLAESQQDFWQQGYDAAKAELSPVAHMPEATNFIGEFETDEPSPSMEHQQEEEVNESPVYYSPEVEGISAEGVTVDGATIDGSDIDTIMDESSQPAEEVTFEEQVSFEPMAEEHHTAHAVDPQAVSEMADFLVSPSSPQKLHSESEVSPDILSTDERLFDDTSMQEPLSEGLFEPQLSDEAPEAVGDTWTAEDNQAETQGFAVPNYMDASFFGTDEGSANEPAQDSNAYADPNAYSQDPNAYSHDPNAYSPDPNAYSQDPNAYSQDPNAYSPDPNAYSQDPNAYSQDPSAYSQDPNAYSQDPNAYSQDPSAYSQDPNAYSQDPNAYSQDPNAYGDQSGYAPDYSTGAEANSGYADQYGYHNEQGYGQGGDPQIHSQEQEQNGFNSYAQESLQQAADPGIAFQASMDAGSSGGFGDPSAVNFADTGFAESAQDDNEEEIEEEKPPAQKFDPNELRNLVQGRLHKHEEAAAGDDAKVNRKFVGGKHQTTNEHANMPRVVAPDIRRACKLLGLRPEELSKAAVLEAWKREMAKPGVHPDTGGDTEMAMYLNNAKDTLVRYLDAQAPKLGKVFGSKGDHGGKDNKDKK